MHALTTGITLTAWMILWGLGGVWLARSAFHLLPREEILVGLACGFFIETFFANILGQLLPLPLAFWLAAGIPFVAGLGLALRQDPRQVLKFSIYPGQLLTFVFIALLAYQINAGLAIQDDYASLPVTSILATGDIPTRFPLNPQASYDYHYFGLLFSAQLMRVADVFVWKALDFMRAFTFAVAMMLVGLWVQRVTRSLAAGVLGALMMAFGGGARWLLLLLPSGLLDRISASLQMLGTGIASGADLRSALLAPWAIDGGGPLPYPFAVVNGVYSPGVSAMLGSNGLGLVMLVAVLLLTGTRWKGWRAGALSAVFVACLGLISETTLVFWLVGWGLTAALLIVRRRKIAFPRSFRRWSFVILAGAGVSLVEGDVLTGMLYKLLSPSSGLYEHQSITFGFSFLPSLVSGHLGQLNLLNLGQLVVALCEVGPLIILFPLLAKWCARAYRAQRWFEVFLLLNAFLSLGILFLHFTGSSGIRNTSRMYEFMGILVLFAVPLFWFWVGRRGQGAYAAGIVVGLTAMAGGIVFSMISFAAIQKPVLSFFISELDAKMSRQYWNQLPRDALVFDRNVSRAPTVLGRYTDTNSDWYDLSPAWYELVDHPSLKAFRSYGFTHIYYDRDTWEALKLIDRQELEQPCVVQMGEAKDDWGDFRRLIDISACP